MRELIASQEQELALLGGQLDQVEVVGRSVTPLMLRMIDALDALVRLDLPFLLDERTERIAKLRKMMTRSDVTSAEMRGRSRDVVRIAGLPAAPANFVVRGALFLVHCRPRPRVETGSGLGANWERAGPNA